MNPSECAKRVLDWAVREAVRASTEEQKSRCNEEARKAASKLWKEYNPNDGVGGFGCNPYEREQEYNLKRIDGDAKTAREAHEVLNFVKNKICVLLDEIEGE